MVNIFKRISVKADNQNEHRIEIINDIIEPVSSTKIGNNRPAGLSQDKNIFPKLDYSIGTWTHSFIQNSFEADYIYTFSHLIQLPELS